VVFEIVGLVPDTKYFTLREDPLPIVFVPISQIEDRRPFTDVMIRSTAPLSDVSSAVRHVVAEIDPLIASELRPLDSTILDGLLRERLMAALSGLFGALGALIAAIGLYGTMSYLVLRRTNEIGVRVALGAQPAEIVLMVLREAGMLSIVGLGLGSLLAFGAARSAQSLVFGVQPYDIRLLGLACALLAAVTIAAGYLPARRAAGLRPLAALREE
jgi:ABC-type antimicrobial peptide transport system permease subunit